MSPNLQIILPPAISIHSPRAGRDRMYFEARFISIRFQSTLPVRGETRRCAKNQGCLEYFNPLSPCGERHLILHLTFGVAPISIHSPRAGRDHSCHGASHSFKRFQSTLPVRGETLRLARFTAGRTISIHSPRAGRDLIVYIQTINPCPFQSTLPVRGETWACSFACFQPVISIHSPRAGRDC